MKRHIIIALLASAILASCTKDETFTPYNPPVPPSDTTKPPIDTTTPPAPNQSPYGTVDAPYLVVSLLDYSHSRFRMEKYRLDGSYRAKLLDDYFSGNHFVDNPDFSAKGDKFCYAEGSGIYILDMNSMSKQEVLGNAVMLESTEMSPDGSRIAYLNWNIDFTLDLNVVSSVGESTPLKLTNFENSYSSAGPPSFSPDGNRIVYSEYPDILVSDWNGRNKIKVYESQSLLETTSYPIFNKEGTRLIYFLHLDYGATVLVTSEIREGGSNDYELVGDLRGYLISNPSYPVLSEDGNTVYFISQSSIYKISLAGGPATRVAYDTRGSNNWQVVGLDYVER